MMRRVTHARWLALASLMLCAQARGMAAEPPPSLAVERTIALPGVKGRIDHLAVDPGRKRLFVAELGNNTVDVIDLTTGAAVQRLSGLKEPQGLAYAPDADVLAVANAGDGSVRLYRGAALSPAGVINLHDDADNVRLDPRTGHFVVGYGRGGLAVIDPVNAAVVTRIPLRAHPEGFQLDADGGHAFVNVPDGNQVAVVDMRGARQTGVWANTGFAANFPMALDAGRGAAAVVFRSPARLVLFNVNTGAVVQTLTACGDADDVFFDTRRRRIYMSCGSGSVDVWQDDGTSYTPRAAVKTAAGARTSLFVPGFDRLFVAARAGFLGMGSDAAILVLRPLD